MGPQSLAATVRASSAPSGSRRIFQLSLRTLLLLLTAGCIWLGVVTKRARDQRAAVNRILELGGSVSFDYEFDESGKRLKDAEPPGWRWLRRQIGDEYFRDVVWVGLAKTSVTDDDLRLIGKLTATERLSLDWTKVSDDGLSHIRRLRRLETLGLTETRITDAGLAHLRDMRQMNHLGLFGTRITDQGLRHIEGMEQLDSLILQNTNVGDGGIDSIMKLKRLVLLNLSSTRVSSDGVKKVWRLPKLTILSISDTAVDDTFVENIGSPTSIADLHLTGTSISGLGLLRLRDALPSCQIDAEFVDLPSGWFNKSAQFSTNWTRLVDRLTALNTERRLKLVGFSGSGITDRYLPDLYSLSNVEVIDLRDTKVTDAGVQALQKSLHKCRVER